MPQHKTNEEILHEIIESWDDLKAVLDWFKERKRAPRITEDADHETLRQTFHFVTFFILSRKTTSVNEISTLQS